MICVQPLWTEAYKNYRNKSYDTYLIYPDIHIIALWLDQA